MAKRSEKTNSPASEGKKSIPGEDYRSKNIDNSLGLMVYSNLNNSSIPRPIEKGASDVDKKSSEAVNVSQGIRQTQEGEGQDDLWSLVTTKCEHLKNFSKLCSYKQAQMNTSSASVFSQSGDVFDSLSSKPLDDDYNTQCVGDSLSRKKSNQSDTFSDSDPDLTVAKVLGNLLSSVSSSHTQRPDAESSSPPLESCCEKFIPDSQESTDENDLNSQQLLPGLSNFGEVWSNESHSKESSHLCNNLSYRNNKRCEPIGPHLSHYLDFSPSKSECGCDDLSLSGSKNTKQRGHYVYDRYGLNCHSGDGDKKSSKFQNWKAAGIALKKALSVESSKQSNHQDLCIFCKNNIDKSTQGTSFGSSKIKPQKHKKATESFEMDPETDPMNAMLHEYTMTHDTSQEDAEIILHDGSGDAQKCSCGQNIEGNDSDMTAQIDTQNACDTVSVKDRILQLTANLMDSHTSTSRSLKKSRTKMCHRKSKPVPQSSSLAVLDESSSDSDDSIIQPKRHKCVLKTKNTSTNEISLKPKYVLSERAKRIKSRKKELFAEKDRSLRFDKKDDGSQKKAISPAENKTLLESSEEDELSYRLSDILSKDVQEKESHKKNYQFRNSFTNYPLVSGKGDRDCGISQLSGSDSFSSDNDSTPIAVCKLPQNKKGNLNLSRNATCAKRRLLLESDSLVNLADVESDSSTNGSSTLEEPDNEMPVPLELWDHFNNGQDELDEDEPMSVEISGGKKDENDDRDFSGSENDCQEEDFEEFLDIPDIPTSPQSDEEQEQLELVQEGLQELEEEEEDSELRFSSGSDNDAEADDEFECDCEVCLRTLTELGLGPRDRRESDGGAVNPFLPNWDEGRINPNAFNIDLSLGLDSDELNDETQGLDRDSIPFSIAIDELRPLELFLMSDRRQDLLDIMFQNVISQMLAVYPDLLGDQAPPPASVLTIESLPVIKIDIQNITDDHVCPICLCKFDDQEEAKQLPCQHIFHTFCIQAWLNKSGTCPVCRQVLDADG